MFIGNTKRFSQHKQQLLSVLGIVDAHLRDENKRTLTIFSGKASQEDYYDK
jgi:glucan phosphorylase